MIALVPVGPIEHLVLGLADHRLGPVMNGIPLIGVSDLRIRETPRLNVSAIGGLRGNGYTVEAIKNPGLAFVQLPSSVKPMSAWVPSQNGLFFEPPQRHSA